MRSSTWWLIYIGIVPTVAAYGLFYRGLRSTESEVAGVLTLARAARGAVLAAWCCTRRLSGAALSARR